MKSVFRIIWKNFKVLLRSRTSSLIFIIGPLLVIFLAGYAFNTTEINKVRVGAYTAEKTNLTEHLVNSIEQNNIAIKYYNQEKDCSNAVREGQISLCLVFSGDLKVAKGTKNEIDILVDNSKINLAYMVLDMVSSGVSNTENSLTKSLTNILIEKIDETQKEIESDKEILVSLTTQSTQEKVDLERAKTRVNDFDLTFEKDDFDTGTIKDTSGKLQVQADALKKEVIASMNYLNSKVEKLANISDSDKESILKKINQSLAKANILTSQMSGKDGDIQSAISGIENNLNALQAQFMILENQREEVLKDFESIFTLLAKDLKLFAQLSESFDRINRQIGSIEVTNAEDISNPITTKISPISVDKTHIYYLFPSLILVVLMFVSLMLSSTLVQAEKSSKAFVRNFMTPTGQGAFILATYLTSILVIILQTGLIIAVSFLVFKFLVLPVLLSTFLIILISSTVFILLGMFIGYLFKSEETSTITSIFLGAGFLFFSDLILPFESMPESVISLAMYNPYVLSDLILKRSLFFEVPLTVLRDKIYILLIYAIVLYCAIYVSQKIFKKHFVFKKKKRK
jgi:ABC-type multidrug transport system permease subunit